MNGPIQFQTEKEKYYMTSLICGISKERIQMNVTKQKMNLRLQGEGTFRDLGKVRYMLLYLK